MRCNLCGGTVFTDMPKRPRVRCASCGSLERTRVAGLYLAGRDRPPDGAAILHFAPERGLSWLLRERGGENYRALDINPSLYPDQDVEAFDICSDVASLDTERYDLIVHNHVLEHVECNYTAVLVHLSRALKPNGLMLFSVPILPGGFSETLIMGSAAEKLDLYGASLHVRCFGADVLQSTLGMVFRMPNTYNLSASFPEAELVEANIPPHHWHTYSGASVFRLKRSDFLI